MKDLIATCFLHFSRKKKIIGKQFAIVILLIRICELFLCDFFLLTKIVVFK